MKAVAYWAGMVLLGLVLGLGSAVAIIEVGSLHGEIAVGPWRASLETGSPDANMYRRALVSVFGLLALDKKETIYFTASYDDAGEKLSGDCTYVVKGRDLAARWWSVTAYGSDSYLMPNDANIYSFSKTTVKRDADGSYVVRVSAEKQDGNWLPVKAGESFDMTARLYNPEPSVYAAPASAVLPTIAKESCK